MNEVENITNELKNIMDVKISNEIKYNMWIRVLEPIALNDKTLYMQAPTKFVVNMVKANFLTMLKESLDMIIDPEVKRSKIILTSPDSENYEQIILKGKKINEDGQMGMDVDKKRPKPQLNPQYTFENFIRGKSNELALAASENVAENSIKNGRTKTYNPLFIYGSSGLGKTHLMQAIAHRIVERNPDKYIMYISSEKFTNEMISSVRENKNEEFRRKYRSVDVLLIDDIQFIANKTGTQEEFFHTFEDLYNAGKQIVISSDKPPREIKQLEDRLRSRFGWGLIVDISRPDFETRVAILQNKLYQENASVTNEVIDYIADNVDTNIRELEGSLLSVLAIANLKKKDTATIDDAKQALKSISKPERRKVTIDIVKDAVCQKFNLRRDQLESKSRKKNIAQPRQIAMYLSRELTNKSLVMIAESFNRDHTTILHGYDKISEQMKKDENLKLAIEDLINEIRG
ncbi:MAG: chromosomal replication initiator protein DnaA [Tissierellia bacterium]|nr:chromosomal replication initiator protein DnaA [Tissierellia bacterium]